MEILVFLLLFFSNCVRCSVNGTAATSNNEQTIQFVLKHHYVAVESPLVLNCTSWNNALSSHDLCWRHNSKAWLIDHTTRLDSRTAQLYIPKVTYANNGTYRCCVYNATLPLGVASCAQTDVVFIGEKPDISTLGPKFRPYGCPPVLMDLSWTAVPSNGDLLEYNVWYQIGSRQPRHMKCASWCTRQSSSSNGSFSCDLKRTVNRSNRRVCTGHCYPLCWKISVTNRFGTASLSPVFQDLKIDTLCPRPRNVRLMRSARGEITIEVDPLENLIFVYVVTYKVKFCYLGTGFTAKEAEELAARTQIQFTGPSNSCDSQTSSSHLTSAHVKIKLVSLKDYSRYAVSVSCNLVTGNACYGLVAGPYNVTTLEQAPIEPPSSLRTRPLTSCGDNRTVAVHFELPPMASWNGRPSRFVVQYWQTGNQTRMNKTSPTSVSSLASGAAVSVNITVECNKEFKVRVMMCTVVCGGWSSLISVSANEHPSTRSIKADAKQSGNWKVAVIAGVVFGLFIVVLFLFLYIYCRRQRTSDSSESSPPQQRLADRTFNIVPTSDDRLNTFPLTDSTGEYAESSVPDDDSTPLLGRSSSSDTELCTFDTQDENNKLAVRV